MPGCGGRVETPDWVVPDAMMQVVLSDWDGGFKAEELRGLGSAGEVREGIQSVLGVVATGLHLVFLVE